MKLGINVSAAKYQANSIHRNADQLRGVKTKLNGFLQNVNHGWKADEITYINAAVSKINSEISRLSSELDSVGSDIVSTAYEIKREEEARERARLERLERLREMKQAD
ncbi:hypothetical protein [Aquibacillus kalidii]|uniref:hypothetical protein n=1 Tax=Aquibacillus kalidii TaxID=2762597 RepID=UPI001C99DD96|nr:hypothetical protein [Aquibacillus kalidii]